MIGPVEQIPIGGGEHADLYLLRFDKDGRLRSPQTAELMLTDARQATDVFVFSHGWNNTYAQALDAYRGFAKGFVAQRSQLGQAGPAGYRPLLVGLIWPSTSFVLPWEQGPDIAGGPSGGASPDRDAQTDAQTEAMLADVTESMSEDDAAALTEIVDGQGALDDEQARAAAELVRSSLWSESDPDSGAPPPDVSEVLEAWQAVAQSTAGAGDDVGGSGDSGDSGQDLDDDFGTADGSGQGQGQGQGQPGGATPQAAGGLGFDPRDVLRLGSLWKMKGRAGTVGAKGVAPLLGRLLGATSARVHLVGHSFGARVMLSAVAASPLPRKVRSLLLLQPAVNRWCFASNVAGTGRAGGYAAVPDRVEHPVVTTYSTHDAALHEFFHLAVRGGSLGEPDIAAVGDTHLYGALGGYGPEGLADGRLRRSNALAAGSAAYDLSAPARVLAVDGSLQLDGHPAIGGHGDISNPVTWWALRNLVTTQPAGT
jgi:hypothetical protein